MNGQVFRTPRAMTSPGSSITAATATGVPNMTDITIALAAVVEPDIDIMQMLEELSQCKYNNILFHN